MSLGTVILLLALGSAACASARPASELARQGVPAQKEQKNQYYDPDGVLVVCRMEAPVGSHIPERVCTRTEGGRSPEQQLLIDDMMRRPTKQNVPPGG